VTLDRPAAELIAALDAALTAIRAEGCEPVIVIDDSDRWFSLPGISDKSALVDQFFGEVVPLLAKRAVAFVIAAHPTYLDRDGYRHAREAGEIDTEIAIPSFEDERGLREVLDRRVVRHSSEHRAGDVFTDAAIQRLFAHYRLVAHGNLRRTLVVAHTALVSAVELNRDLVDEDLVHAAITGDDPG